MVWFIAGNFFYPAVVICKANHFIMPSSLPVKNIALMIAAASVIIFITETCTQPSSSKKEINTDTSIAMQDTHLGELMGHMQYNFLKLGLAIQHRNQPLAIFYMHEVNEAYGAIVSQNIKDGTLDVSLLASQILAPAKQRLEDAIVKNDTTQFTSAYHSVVMACNNCHIETNHSFIEIEEPRSDFNGQNFGIQHSLYSE